MIKHKRYNGENKSWQPSWKYFVIIMLMFCCVWCFKTHTIHHGLKTIQYQEESNAPDIAKPPSVKAMPISPKQQELLEKNHLERVY